MPGIQNNLKSFNNKSTVSPRASLPEIANTSTQGDTEICNPKELQDKVGDNAVPMLTITSNSARSDRRAHSFYQDLVEGKSLLGVQLVRQQTKEFFDENQIPVLDTPADRDVRSPPFPSQQTTNNYGPLNGEEKTSKMQLVGSVGNDIISSKRDTGVISSDSSTSSSEGNNNITAVESLKQKTDMASSPNAVEINNMYGDISDSDSDADNSASDDVINDNNNKETKNKNSDVTAEVTSTTDSIVDGEIVHTKGIDDNEKILNSSDSRKKSVGENFPEHIEGEENTMDGSYTQDMDFNKLPNSSFLQTLEQQSNESDGDDDISEGYSQEFPQRNSLGGGGDGLPTRNDLPVNGEELVQDHTDNEEMDEPLAHGRAEVDDVRGTSTPKDIAEDSDTGERIDRRSEEHDVDRQSNGKLNRMAG